MDPIAMASAVVAVLSPFIAKGTEEFVKGVGKSAAEVAGAMLAKLKSRWFGDAEAKGTLEAFQTKPARHADTLTQVLAERLATDEDLRSALAGLLEQLGPQLRVVQQMITGSDVVGVRADELVGGSVDVTQHIDNGSNIVGADIKRIGG